MHCPRIEHFVRLQPSGKIGKCGHMVDQKTFDSLEEMQESEWLSRIRKQFRDDKWPDECVRCQASESINKRSIRLDMIERDRILRSINKDYLMVGGVLDNICNSACQSCNSTLSTKIGSLGGSDFLKINNYERFFSLPQERIIEIDVSGGEPTASPNYKKLLNNLPKNVQIIRINTNGSRMIKEIESLLDNGVRVIITLSLDGVGRIHDYVRWPIVWSDYKKNVEKYLVLGQKYENLRLNTWTTLSCLNVGNLNAILQYVNKLKLDHSYGFCVRPSVLDIRHDNLLNRQAKLKFCDNDNVTLKEISKKCATWNDNSKMIQGFIQHQDKLRKINFEDYFKLCPQDL